MNQESFRTCKQRGHCSCAWGLSLGVDSSPGSGCASPTTLALVPLTWARSPEDITPGLLLPAALRGECLTHYKHLQAELEQL